MTEEKYTVRPEVLTDEEVMQLIPQLEGHPKVARWLMHTLKMDDMNRVHSIACDTAGPECARKLLDKSLNISLKIDNEEILDRLPEGAFITVSNHPFGALDGIALIDLVGSRRPEFKVMVNMILNRVSGLRPNFIAVDAWAQKDPAKRAVSVRGIAECLRQLKEGKPMGFFPAGAMSKTNWKGQLIDRPWQESVLRIIHRAKVPVVPIYFQGSNSKLFNLMGHICWPLRSLMLPREIMKKAGKTIHVTIGQPISVEEQAPHAATPDTLGVFLRERTYALRQYP
ncbi:MAG: lysophospholipid acyltransferase family protein [Bacteroides sp.]|nr:lysophospholipid acyltransferase family protein [Bacteroides sp.]MCM1379300.1 lysophospholipid acyltransferase family protein [Bacteroides sp.]MCM1445041.1 lysophospholipid acyltransferase family protein [Prevotella sp.]